jgi:DNA polymerase III delta subunit
MDVQEVGLREGRRPDDGQWGEDPPDQWGTLTDGNTSRQVPTERGAYHEFYAEVAQAIRQKTPPPVPIADAIADGVRTVSRVAAAPRANAYSVAGDLRMPPWKVERAQRQARGWSAAGLGRAMRVAATLNADVKGNASDPVYAL